MNKSTLIFEISKVLHIKNIINLIAAYATDCDSHLRMQLLNFWFNREIKMKVQKTDENREYMCVTAYNLFNYTKRTKHYNFK